MAVAITLFDMFPAFSLNNCPNRFIVNAIFFAKFAIRFVATSMASAHLAHLRLGKFCLPIPFTEALPTLIYHISMIVLDRAKEEMVRVNTGTIVTFMKCTKAIWYWAEVQLPTHAMSAGVMSRSIMCVDYSIAIRGTSLPNPTFIRRASGNVVPETDRYWYTLVMTDDKANRHSFDKISSTASHIGNWRREPTTAQAKSRRIRARFTEWKFELKGIRVMLRHVNSPFLTLTTPPSDSRRCGGNLLQSLIIVQMNEVT